MRLPSLTEPAWYSDDGFFMSVSWLSSRGFRLYSGVYDNSPPGVYWIYRLMLALGARDHHYVVQAFAAVAAIAAALLTFEIGLRLAGAWAATLAGALTGFVLSLPVLDGDLFNVELAGLPFFLAALVLAFHRRPMASFASGVLLCAALAIRPSYLLDASAIPVAIALSGDPLARLGAAAAGLATTAAAISFVLLTQGSLSAYVGTVLPSDHAYLVWVNGGSLLPLAIRLALLSLVAAWGLTRSRSLQGRLLAVWIPAAIAGASLTPRELTHYGHEAAPALATGLSVLAARFRPHAASAPAAAIAMVAAIEAVLILPAYETALVQRTGAPPAFLHNFAYTALPAYYANWAAYVTGARPAPAYDAWFPGQASLDEAEIGVLRVAAGPHAARILVLGDRPWLYVKGGLEPATPFIATNSSFWQVSWGPAAVASAIAGGCADYVIEADPAVPTSWLQDLHGPGYEPLAGAPWPTFAPVSRSPSC